MGNWFENTYNIFSSFEVQSFVLPLLGVVATIFLKMVAKEKGSFVKEDAAVGIELGFAAFVALYIYHITLTHQLSVTTDEKLRLVIENKSIQTTDRLIILGACIFGVATLIRYWGWQTKDKLNWPGLAIPILLGGLALWYVYTWTGAQP